MKLSWKKVDMYLASWSHSFQVFICSFLLFFPLNPLLIPCLKYPYWALARWPCKIKTNGQGKQLFCVRTVLGMWFLRTYNHSRQTTWCICVPLGLQIVFYLKKYGVMIMCYLDVRWRRKWNVFMVGFLFGLFLFCANTFLLRIWSYIQRPSSSGLILLWTLFCGLDCQKNHQLQFHQWQSGSGQ